MFKVEDISYRFEDDVLNVFTKISLTVERGEIVAIVGPSGCGKTTFLKTIAGLIEPTEGIVKRSGISIGMVFQHHALIPWNSVKENALIGATLQLKDEQELMRSFNRLSALFGLEGYSALFPAVLSGGMKQRLSIIRALISEPDLMLLDEPFSSSDFEMKKILRYELRDFVNLKGSASILVTHHLEDALLMADRILIFGQKPACILNSFSIQIPFNERFSDSNEFHPDLRLLHTQVAEARLRSNQASC